MGFDYYKILEVDRNAGDDDLKKAYNKLNRRWHNIQKEADAQSEKISEAYRVLSDPQKRAVYDRYGEEGLKGQVPPPGAGGFSGGPSNGSGRNMYSFNPRSSDDIFSEFFGFTSGEGMVDMGRGRSGDSARMFGEDIFNYFGDGEGSASMPLRKGAAIERTLHCSLEDLYNGTTKKMKISRDVAGANGA